MLENAKAPAEAKIKAAKLRGIEKKVVIRFTG